MKACLNGKIIESEAAFFGRNYVYAAILAVRHRPLHAARHLKYAFDSYKHLWGQRPPDELAEWIEAAIPPLLRENRMPETGSVVRVCLRPAEGEPEWLITVEESLPCHGYELSSLRPRAAVASYGLPLTGHRTAISLAAAEYMDDFAVQSGAHIALRTERDGRLVSAGDYPVFVLSGGRLVTPVAPEGTGSVERDLMGEVCRMAGVELQEGDITCEDLAETEEVMIFGVSGIRSLMSCGGRYLYNLTAMELEKYLKT
jgi:branched-subunit amino acid aminotransferase/4-amino-4-deoxychorismate lyase